MNNPNKVGSLDGQFVTATEAGKMLSCGPDNVRHLERNGKLSAIRTSDGVRLFLKTEVEQLAQEREKNNKKRC